MSSFDTQSDTDDVVEAEAAIECTLIHVGSPENGFDRAGESYDLGGIHKIRFGRSLDPKIMEIERSEGVLHVGVPLPWVSGVHCEVRVRQTGRQLQLELQDLKSRNGTYVESESVEGIAAVAPGEIFEVGRSFWTVRELDVPTTDKPADDSQIDGDTCCPAVRQVIRALSRVARSGISVLLTGETGTGKEHLARRIHEISGRPGEFIRTNLSAFEPKRIEQVLAGDDGLLRRGEGGTLFVADVGDLTVAAQRAVLGALGSARSGNVDSDNSGVRVIAATIRPLRELVSEAGYRPELYSRLAGFEAHLPPLRSRREDLGQLMQRQLAQAGEQAPAITTKAFRYTLQYAWPFNVRQFEQALTTAIMLSSGSGKVSREVMEEVLAAHRDIPTSAQGIQELRRQLLSQLEAHGGDVEAVAAALGRDGEDVRRWIRRFDLNPGVYKH